MVTRTILQIQKSPTCQQLLRYAFSAASPATKASAVILSISAINFASNKSTQPSKWGEKDPQML